MFSGGIHRSSSTPFNLAMYWINGLARLLLTTMATGLYRLLARTLRGSGVDLPICGEVDPAALAQHGSQSSVVIQDLPDRSRHLRPARRRFRGGRIEKEDRAARAIGES